MEIRGTAWTTGDLEPVLKLEYINSEVFTDPIGAIESAEGRVIERLTTGRAVQKSLITYSMGSGEFDFIVKNVRERALKEGREEAWDLARRIVTGDCSDSYAIDDEILKIFGKTTWNVLKMPVEEAMSKDKEYQEEKKALHVGDEVEFDIKMGFVSENHRGYITNLISPVRVRALTENYGTITISPEKCKKTGKHSEEIERAMASFEKGE